MEAETTVYGESFNQWGSTLLANGTDPFSNYTFQYYLRVDNEIRLNDSQAVATVIPDAANGTLFRINIISDGSGTINTQLIIDGQEADIYPFSLSSIASVCKATLYPATIAVSVLEDTRTTEVDSETFPTVYVEDRRIKIEGLYPNEAYAIYSIAGTKKNTRERLPDGVYIVSVRNKSYKVIVHK